MTGGGTSKDGKERVKVLFPGNKGNINCCLTEVRRLRAAPAVHPHAYVAPLCKHAATTIAAAPP